MDSALSEKHLHKLVKMMQLIKKLCLRINNQLRQQKDNVMNQINSWKFVPIFTKKTWGLIQAPYEA